MQDIYVTLMLAIGVVVDIICIMLALIAMARLVGMITGLARKNSATPHRGGLRTTGRLAATIVYVVLPAAIAFALSFALLRHFGMMR